MPHACSLVLTFKKIYSSISNKHVILLTFMPPLMIIRCRQRADLVDNLRTSVFCVQFNVVKTAKVL